jgi:hypothetical protein
MEQKDGEGAAHVLSAQRLKSPDPKNAQRFLGRVEFFVSRMLDGHHS